MSIIYTALKICIPLGIVSVILSFLKISVPYFNISRKDYKCLKGNKEALGNYHRRHAVADLATLFCVGMGAFGFDEPVLRVGIILLIYPISFVTRRLDNKLM